ncbi:MAG: class I tRNA ligase family protein, partial [Acidobacteriaceae bacterium]
MSDKTFYVTTPIYYVNARPHIGHAYTTIVADVLARRHRLLGEQTFFLTGTDEHGQKIERSAAAAGIPPQQFADQVSKSFSDLWQRMGITHNDYIRTTSPKHKQGVQHLFSELYKNGFIYLSTYTGAYCVSDEAFVDAPVGTPCPDCGRLLESVTEENFFFKLSAFQKPLLDLIESNTLTITPESRRNEVLSFLRGNVLAASLSDAVILSEARSAQPKDPDTAGPTTTADTFSTLNVQHSAAGTPYVPGALKDLSISRSSFTWGIPVPNDVQRAAGATQRHVIYVWLDALANYITALGYGSDDETLFKKFWPANIHLVGKEIIRFHCVYWPAFLLALNPAYNTPNTDAPNPEAVILSEGRSPQSKDPDTSGPTTTANPFSTSNVGTRAPQLTFDQHKTWAEKWLPKAVTAHGWLLFEESKMSKSRGNIVRTETILEAFGTLCPPPTASNEPNLNPSVSASNEPNLNPSVSALKGTGFSPSVSALKGTGFSPSVNPSPNEPALAAEGISPGSSSGLQPTESDPNQKGALAPGFSAPTQHDRDLFASDVLRYFLLREIPFGQDGSFSFDAMITRYNADLANGYGNLVSRVLSMIARYFNGTVPEAKEPWLLVSDHTSGPVDLTTFVAQRITQTAEIIEKLSDTRKAVEEFQKSRFDQLLLRLAAQVKIVDIYLSAHEPWNLAKLAEENDDRRLTEVLYTAAESIRIITALLYPILPYATSKVWAQLGLGDIELAAKEGKLTNLEWGGLTPGTRLGPLGSLFPRIYEKDIPGFLKIMTDMENPTPADTTPADPAAVPPTADPAAAPRTSTLNEPTSTLPVAGST